MNVKLFLIALVFVASIIPFSYAEEPISNDPIPSIEENNSNDLISSTKGDDLISTGIWIISIIVGALAVIFLLLYTTTLSRPKQFSTLPIIQFFFLSILLASLITAVTFLPDDFHSLPISKTIIGNGTDAEWFLSVGEKSTRNSDSIFQIPYSIIIPGLLGAYIRYLYKDIKEFRITLKKDLETLKHSFLEHRNKVFEIMLAIDVTIHDVMRIASIKDSEKDPYITIKDLLALCQCNNDYIYSLPPQAITPFSRYIRDRFGELSLLETKYEKQSFQVGDKINIKTLTTVGSFFLAPLLAVVAWLILGLGANVNWQTEIIIAFGAGLSADAIVNKIWSITGEKFKTDDDDDEEIASKLKIQNITIKPTSGVKPLSVDFVVTITGESKTIEWDFADGNTDTGGLSKNHTFSSAGTFNGKVKITDKKNNSEEKGFTITVTEV